MRIRANYTKKLKSRMALEYPTNDWQLRYPLQYIRHTALFLRMVRQSLRIPGIAFETHMHSTKICSLQVCILDTRSRCGQ